MTYFDNKMAVVGQLGLVQGYVNGLKSRLDTEFEENKVKFDDLEYVSKILENIEKLLFEKEGDK